MKITYYKGKRPNFGDDLNPWMWPKVIPDFFDEDASAVFLGIGSIIGETAYDKAVKKIVFGAGFVPEYHEKPDMSGNDWRVYFVRGPRTAKMLGLAPELALGDSAILLRTVVKPAPDLSGPVSFMPHWESMQRGNWTEVCRLAGIRLVNPQSPVETVIEDLRTSRLVIAEAMHGAVVADALRVPWIPVLPLNAAHRAKWLDWSEPLGVGLHPRRLWPSSLAEAKLSFLRKMIAGSPFAALSEKGLVHAAAQKLTDIARTTAPRLSEDRVIGRATEKMLEKIVQLRRDFR